MQFADIRSDIHQVSRATQRTGGGVGGAETNGIADNAGKQIIGDLPGYFQSPCGDVDGKNFTGERQQMTYQPVQTPLRFEKTSRGGYKNKSFQLIHYTFNHQIEAVKY